MRVAGFGFRSAATAASLRDALDRAGGGADGLATSADKAATPVFRGFAGEMRLPVLAVAPEISCGPADDHALAPGRGKVRHRLAGRGGGACRRRAGGKTARPARGFGRRAGNGSNRGKD